ncbi:class I SAM-dependent methyltransferase [Hoyosella rhizosphaerae]|uniref:Methyltransferase domain-containing protein n=1 Tax=Hoyosella rhizosphaerae TaxID=1755582 RepID=A0A916U0M9_9ACTN|nr:class I SAM-dependent methyltransferase [Hoyosella rhizosphaerae]MBN4926874.1 class I SAM-dependent methyltransferase [Hoyosella rhizosphaerae]GGC55830.1 hypothetical protein GCM10011410_05300 [Hoyosella rhizosphaerae]
MGEFDKGYWEEHWAPTVGKDSAELPVNPYIPTETKHLTVGTALDAGCGTGAEALWLAANGWVVTGADISANALTTGAARASAANLTDQIEWVEADLGRWETDRRWDLVVTSYAHPDTGQLAFYRRLSSWVAPGGTILIIGHLHGADHGHGHPDGATATLSGIKSLFEGPGWTIDVGYQTVRTVHVRGHSTQLHDVVVRAHSNS